MQQEPKKISFQFTINLHKKFSFRKKIYLSRNLLPFASGDEERRRIQLQDSSLTSWILKGAATKIKEFWKPKKFFFSFVEDAKQKRIIGFWGLHVIELPTATAKKCERTFQVVAIIRKKRKCHTCQISIVWHFLSRFSFIALITRIFPFINFILIQLSSALWDFLLLASHQSTFKISRFLLRPRWDPFLRWENCFCKH